jgi:hypothetical protein
LQCTFALGKWRYREERQGAAMVLVLIPRDGTEARMIKGQPVDIVGDCAGWDETVKLVNCDIAR